MIRNANIDDRAMIDPWKVRGLVDPWAGEVFYVDNSGNPKGAGGISFFSSIMQAHAKCQAHRQDVIVVLPGHSETISASGDITISKAGVRVVGVGGRTTRPTITIGTAASAKLLVTGADVTIENLQFVAAVADIVRGVYVTAKGCTIRNCLFREGTDLNFLVAIEIGAADNDSDDCTIEDCIFDMPDALDTNAILMAKNQRRLYILRNHIYGDFATAAHPIAAVDTEILNAGFIADNIIYNAAGDGVALISFAAATSSGMLARNLGACADADGTHYLFSGGSFNQNFAAGALNVSGALYPATS